MDAAAAGCVGAPPAERPAAAVGQGDAPPPHPPGSLDLLRDARFFAPGEALVGDQRMIHSTFVRAFIDAGGGNPADSLTLWTRVMARYPGGVVAARHAGQHGDEYAAGVQTDGGGAGASVVAARHAGERGAVYAAAVEANGGGVAAAVVAARRMGVHGAAHAGGVLDAAAFAGALQQLHAAARR
jgi:hypothetical protein